MSILHAEKGFQDRPTYFIGDAPSDANRDELVREQLQRKPFDCRLLIADGMPKIAWTGRNKPERQEKSTWLSPVRRGIGSMCYARIAV